MKARKGVEILMRNKLSAVCSVVTYIMLREILTPVVYAIDTNGLIKEASIRYTGLTNPVDCIALLLLTLGMLITVMLEIKHSQK